MPKKTTRVIERPAKMETLEEVIEPTNQEIIDEAEKQEKLEEFQKKFAGKQYRVRVKMFDKTDLTWKWVDRVPLDSFDPFSFGKRYGGGKFVFEFCDSEGKYIPGGRSDWDFAPSLVEDTEKKPVSPLADPAVQALVESLKSNQTMMLEVFKTMAPAQLANVPKAMEPDKIMDMILKAMAVGGKGDDFEKMIRMMKLMDDLKGDKEGAGGTLAEIVEAIKAAGILRQTLPRPAGPRPAAPTPRPAAPSAPIPGAGSTVISNPPESETTMNPVLESALFYVPKFEKAARANEDIDTWAEYLLTVLDTDIVPQVLRNNPLPIGKKAVYTRLVEATRDPAILESIFTYAPALAAYREWVYAVLGSAVEMHQTEEEPIDSSEPPGAPVVMTHDNGDENNL
jgi:hypothetical protein